jgi:hypothetical protein
VSSLLKRRLLNGAPSWLGEADVDQDGNESAITGEHLFCHFEACVLHRARRGGSLNIPLLAVTRKVNTIPILSHELEQLGYRTLPSKFLVYAGRTQGNPL